MEEDYKNYCIESVKNMLSARGGNPLQIYRFLLNNALFLEHNENFRNTSIRKAKELIVEAEEEIIKAPNSIIKNKFINVTKVLKEFLEKYDKKET
jgi:hypothetical protein